MSRTRVGVKASRTAGMASERRKKKTRKFAPKPYICAMAAARRVSTVTRKVIEDKIRHVGPSRHFSSSSASLKQPQPPLLIFGLGNPGDKYLRTRHNIGFSCVDAIAQRYNIELRREKFDSVYGGSCRHLDAFVLRLPTQDASTGGYLVAKWEHFRMYFGARDIEALSLTTSSALL